MQNKILKAWRIFHAEKLVKRKLKFIAWFESKFPGKYCWTDCVAWSYSPKRFNPFKVDTASGCRTESLTHSTGSCYCGGWNNGKCWDLLGEKEKQAYREEMNKAAEVEPTIPF